MKRKKQGELSAKVGRQIYETNLISWQNFRPGYLVWSKADSLWRYKDEEGVVHILYPGSGYEDYVSSGGFEADTGDIVLIGEGRAGAQFNMDGRYSLIEDMQGPINERVYGTVVWIEDLDFWVTECGYWIQGERFTSPPADHTLAPSDPLLNRIDVFYVDVNSVSGVLTGIPAADPAKPVVDPITQLELTDVLIPAGATEPAGMTNELVYDENVEWTTSIGPVLNIDLKVDFDWTDDPYQGSKCARMYNDGSGTILSCNAQFENVAPISLVGTTLSFWLRTNKNWRNTSRLNMYFWNGTEWIKSWGFQRGVNNPGFDDRSRQWQRVAFSVDAMPLYGSSNLADILQIRASGSWRLGTELYIDVVEIKGGTTPAPSLYDSYIQLTDTDNDYTDHAGEFLFVNQTEDGVRFNPRVTDDGVEITIGDNMGRMGVVTIFGDETLLEGNANNAAGGSWYRFYPEDLMFGVTETGVTSQRFKITPDSITFPYLNISEITDPKSAVTKEYVDQQTGGGIPTGTDGQTLRNESGSWVVSDRITDGGGQITINSGYDNDIYLTSGNTGKRYIRLNESTSGNGGIQLKSEQQGFSGVTYMDMYKEKIQLKAGFIGPTLRLENEYAFSGENIWLGNNTNAGFVLNSDNDVSLIARGDDGHSPELFLDHLDGSVRMKSTYNYGTSNSYVKVEWDKITLNAYSAVAHPNPGQVGLVLSTLNMVATNYPISKITEDQSVATREFVLQETGGGIPTGTDGQTLRNDSGSWVVDDDFTNNDQFARIQKGGNLIVVDTAPAGFDWVYMSAVGGSNLKVGNGVVQMNKTNGGDDVNIDVQDGKARLDVQVGTDHGWLTLTEDEFEMRVSSNPDYTQLNITSIKADFGTSYPISKITEDQSIATKEYVDVSVFGEYDSGNLSIKPKEYAADLDDIESSDIYNCTNACSNMPPGAVTGELLSMVRVVTPTGKDGTQLFTDDVGRVSTRVCAANTWSAWQYIGPNRTVEIAASATHSTASTPNLDVIVHSTYSATGTQVITLSTADVIVGKEITIKDAGGNADVYTITIDTQGAETIDGEADAEIATNYGVVTVYSDGNNWFIKN